MSSDEDVDPVNASDLFKEPDDYFKPEQPPTFSDYQLVDGRHLRLRLVGHSPLWVCLLTQPVSEDSVGY